MDATFLSQDALIDTAVTTVRSAIDSGCFDNFQSGVDLLKRALDNDYDKAFRTLMRLKCSSSPNFASISNLIDPSDLAFSKFEFQRLRATQH